MKILFLFLFPFLVSQANEVERIQPTSIDVVGVTVKLCWKGPKGNQTCVSVSIPKALREGSEIHGDAYMSGQGMVLRFSQKSLTSFTILEDVSVEGCDSNINLKKGNTVAVVNGVAFIE